MNVNKIKYSLITEEEKQKFIELYSNGTSCYGGDTFYNFNLKGLSCLERLGYCSEYSHNNIPREFCFEKVKQPKIFSFDIFENGEFQNKFYKDEV